MQRAGRPAADGRCIQPLLPAESPQQQWLQVYLEPFGAGDGIRTRDPLLGKQLRYHCATPAWCSQYTRRSCRRQGPCAMREISQPPVRKTSTAAATWHDSCSHTIPQARAL
jgi:hypothetical protein